MTRRETQAAGEVSRLLSLKNPSREELTRVVREVSERTKWTRSEVRAALTMSRLLNRGGL